MDLNRRKFLKATAAASGVAAVSTLPTPAIASGNMEINMVSTWPRDFPGLGTGAQRFAANLEAMTDGRMKVNYFAAGERVKAFDSFDEVASGNAQMYHSAEYYWKGKHPGFAYFTGVPFGLTCTEINAWVHFGGGQELWDELTSGYGLKCLPCGNTGVQMGGWFRKEINSVDDLKGLKMRIPGLGGDVMAKLGASPVSLPGGQIYENLMSGAIDATEWVGPYNDYFLKFYEAAKYYYTGGMHEPGGGLGFGMNLDFWNNCTDHEKAVITAACMEENAAQPEEAMANNGTYLRKLVDEHGTQLRSYNDDVWDAFGEASAEVFEETRQHSELAARVNDSYMGALKEIGGFRAIAEIEFSQQRNRVLGLT